MTLRQDLGLYFLSLLLFGALAVGGASLEGEGAHALLFAFSGAILTTILLLGSLDWISGNARFVFVLLGLIVGLSTLQTVPLPTEWVGTLTDANAATGGLDQLGHSSRSAPTSFAPEATVGSILAFLLPAATFGLIASLSWRRVSELLVWAIPFLGATTASLGLAQVFGGEQSPLYFYEFTNRGAPTGLFANVNHQASFLLMCLPFTVVAGGRVIRSWRGRDKDFALGICAAALFLLLLIGIASAGSVAGYILLVPILLSSLLLLRGRKSTLRGYAKYGAIPALVFLSVAIVASSPVLENLGATSFKDNEFSRVGFTRTSLEIFSHHYAFGTGLGTFSDVYHLYENQQKVDSTYVAHAHNDYLEWATEMGYPGIFILAVFLVWWGIQMARIWGNSASGSELRRAASIATFVVILHSTVDYPLRTPAISCLAATCLALMVVTHVSKRKSSSAMKENAAHKTITL